MDPNENIPADKDADLQLCGSLPGYYNEDYFFCVVYSFSVSFFSAFFRWFYR